MKPVLSLFHGIDLFGMAFDAEGFCVVRACELELGFDARDFIPARHAFSGIIAGTPCQDFSLARRDPPTGYGLEMCKEFCRIVTVAQPDWFLHENVPQVPDLHIPGYIIQRIDLNARQCGSKQNRHRHFQFGYKSSDSATFGGIEIERLPMSKDFEPCVTANDTTGRSFADLCELQGLPRGFKMPFIAKNHRVEAIGNGVPLQMGRVLARAIKKRCAVTLDASRHVTENLQGPVTDIFRSSATVSVSRNVTNFDLRGGTKAIPGSVTKCACGCDRPVTGRKKTASVSCRKRLQRRRENSPVPVVHFKPECIAPFSDVSDREKPVRYLGAKNGSGVYQTIINNIPECARFYEACFGTGAISRRIRPAAKMIGVDPDKEVLKLSSLSQIPNFAFYCADAFVFFHPNNFRHGRDAFIYLDPPYLLETRAKRPKKYKFEVSRAWHEKLLLMLAECDSNVMISAYRNDLYDEILAGWRRVDYWTTNSAGQRVQESLYMNYAEPEKLHDTRYVGADYRKRWSLTKKKLRLVKKFKELPALERAALLEELKPFI